MSKWVPEHFTRRTYEAFGEGLDSAKQISVILAVDGKPFIRAQAREPGMLSVISLPQSQGISVEWVEVAQHQYSDLRMPNGQVGPLLPWHVKALGL